MFSVGAMLGLAVVLDEHPRSIDEALDKRLGWNVTHGSS